MPDTTCLTAAVLLAAAITFALRALPFAVIAPLRASPLAGELATRMPAGLMLILVVYLLRDVPTQTSAVAAGTLAAAVLVAVLQLWRSNALLSIFAGTTVYVLATNLLVRSRHEPTAHQPSSRSDNSSLTTRSRRASASPSATSRPARSRPT